MSGVGIVVDAIARLQAAGARTGSSPRRVGPVTAVRAAPAATYFRK
jgi:hypothetical protein